MTTDVEAELPVVITQQNAISACASVEAILVERLGARTGRGVVVAIADPAVAAATLFTLPRSFAVAPIRQALRLHEAETLLDRLQPAALVTDSPDGPLAEAARKRQLHVVVVARRPGVALGGFAIAATGSQDEPAPATRRYPDETAIILQTSGTTGTPKIVALSRSNVDAAVASVVASLALGPDDRTLTMMPLTHIHGLIATLHATLVSGGAVAATDPRDVHAYWRAQQTFRPTWFSVAPTLLAAVCDARPSDPPLASGALRFIRCASSPLSSALQRRAETLFGAPVLQAYGMTEACHQACSNTLAANRAGSVGMPGAGTSASIRSEAGKLSAPGEIGEVCLAGPNMFRGYAEISPAPAQPAGATHWDRWFRTGDLGRIDKSGFLWLEGRIKEQINRGGETLSPVEIEQALAALPTVRTVAVFAIPHPTLGEEVAAVCVGARPDATEREILSGAAERLSFEKLPKRIFMVDEIPVSEASGKVSRSALADRYGPGAWDAAPTVTTSVTLDSDAMVERAFLAALSLTAIDPDASFFALGGTSLQAARIVCAIERACGVALPVSELISSPSVSAMRRRVVAALAAPKKDARKEPPARPSAGEILPESLVDFCLAQELEPERDDLRQRMILRFAGDVSPDRVSRAFSEMTQAHGALRRSVRRTGDGLFAFEEHPAAAPSIVVFEDEVSHWSASSGLACFFATPIPVDAAPLVQIAAQRLRGGGYVFGLQAAEIVFDGYARAAFLAELAGRVDGRTPQESPDLFRPLTARAARPRTVTAPEPADDILEPPTDLPGDPKAKAAFLERPLDRFSWDDVRALARECSATPFAVAFSVFATALNRSAGGPVDIMCSVQRRIAVDEFRTIGNFAERATTHMPVTPGETFADVARTAAARLLDTLERRDGRKLAIGERLAMFEVEDEVETLIADGGPHGAELAANLRSVVVETIRPSRIPGGLSLTIRPGGSGRDGEPGREGLATLAFDSGSYSEVRAVAILDAFMVLFQRVIADPLLQPACAPLTPDGAPVLRAALLPELEPQDPALAAAQRLDGLFDALAARTPEAKAATGGGRSLSFAELAAAAAPVVGALNAIGVTGRVTVYWDAPRTGGGAGDLATGWSAPYAIATVAILKAGGVIAPVGKAAATAQLARITKGADASAIVTHADALPDALLEFYEPFAKLSSPLGPLNIFRSRGVRLTPTAPDGAAYLMHSSGTTGAPKGIFQSHRAMIDLIDGVRCAGIWPDGHVMPGHDIGFDVFTGALWTAWSKGFAVHAPDAFDYSPAAVVELRTAGVMTFMTSPTVISSLLTQDLGCLTGFALVVLTGEETPVALASRLAALGGTTRFLNLYGPTETTVWATGAPVAPQGRRVPIGQALKGYALEIGEHQSLLPAPRNFPGEILIAAPSAPLGYLANPLENARRFVRRSTEAGPRVFYRSGDVGWIDAKGVLHYAGRRDRQVQLAGIRVELAGVEAALAQAAGVGQVAVIDVTTPSGPYLAAFLVPAAASARSDDLAASALDEARRTLPSSAVPHVVRVVQSLPKLRSGKRDHDALRHMAREAPSRPGRGLQEGSNEAKVAAVWSALLGRVIVSADAEFLASGGTSLGIIRLTTRLKATFGVDIAVAELFISRTVAAQAALIERRGAHEIQTAPPDGSSVEHRALIRKVGGSSVASRNGRRLILGFPVKNGLTAPIGALVSLLRGSCSLSFLEATDSGLSAFENRRWLDIARDAAEIVRAENAGGGPPVILCGFSFGGWLAWLTERVCVEAGVSPAPRVINLDGGALHLRPKPPMAAELHEVVARAQSKEPSDMLLVGRMDDEAGPFLKADLWREVSASIVRTPPVKSFSHFEISKRPLLTAVTPFIERWIEGDDGTDWPPFLALPRTPGMLLFDAFNDPAADLAAIYRDVRDEFLEQPKFKEINLAFELLALKMGDVDAALVMADKHFARNSRNRYAVQKQVAALHLKGSKAEAIRIADVWLADHPDDMSMRRLSTDTFKLPARAPEGRIAGKFNWWSYLLAEALRRGAKVSAKR